MPMLPSLGHSPVTGTGGSWWPCLYHKIWPAGPDYLINWMPEIKLSIFPLQELEIWNHKWAPLEPRPMNNGSLEEKPKKQTWFYLFDHRWCHSSSNLVRHPVSGPHLELARQFSKIT